MSNYTDKLKDPRWQKKRLEILERDKWTCQYCYDDFSTLVVHHKIYIPDKEPWDYPDNLLITLCEDCHNKEKDERPAYEQSLLETLKVWFSSEDIHGFVNCLRSFQLLHLHDLVGSAYGWALSSKEAQILLIDAYFNHLQEKARGK